MQLELQRTNDAELLKRKQNLWARLSAMLEDYDLMPDKLRFLAESGFLTKQEREVYDELRRVNTLLQED